jgi:hypothetical protein
MASRTIRLLKKTNSSYARTGSSSFKKDGIKSSLLKDEIELRENRDCASARTGNSSFKKDGIFSSLLKDEIELRENREFVF